jgi:hypothetical protein
VRLQTTLRNLLRQAGADEGWWRQVVVIGAKAGQGLRLIYHSRAYAEKNPEKMKGYEADLTKVIGDIMVHCYIVAEMLGKPIEEIFDEAVVSFRDEMANIVKKRETKI